MGQTSKSTELSNLVAEGSIDTVIAAFPDYYGRLMGKRFRADYFMEHILQGQAHVCDYLLTCDMDLEPLAGFRFSSWDSGYGDMQLQPDSQTMRRLPWLEGSALILCDLLSEEGLAIEVSPRWILKRQIEACQNLGFYPQMASELEFYLFQQTADQIAQNGFQNLRPTTDYLIDYHILGTTKDEGLLRQIRNLMPTADIPVECSKGEWGRGQHEVNLQYTDALQMADRHVIFKDGVKTLAAGHGVTATFMAKVSHQMAGSSCHVHTSLVSKQGDNLFWDAQTGTASKLFEAFVAGNMKYARHLALFFAPTVNSYKRYRSSTFAPVSIAWDKDNRTCGFRVVGHGASLRVENRIPGADVNPYLAFAATLASGLRGIQQELTLPERTKGNAYETPGIEQVPKTLEQAIAALDADNFAQSAFGAETLEHFRHLVLQEHHTLQDRVTDVELRRYLERI